MIFGEKISSLFNSAQTSTAAINQAAVKEVAESFIGFTVAVAATGFGLLDGGMRYLANTYGYNGPEPDIGLPDRDIAAFDQAYRELGLRA